MSDLKLKGRKLYRRDTLVAEVKGCRETTRDNVYAEFCVVAEGVKVATGFVYFKDAVRWARDAYSLERVAGMPNWINVTYKETAEMKPSRHMMKPSRHIPTDADRKVYLDTAGVRNHAAAILDGTGYILERVNGHRNWLHVTDLTGITRIVYFWRGVDLWNLARLLSPEQIEICTRIRPEGGFF